MKLFFLRCIHFMFRILRRLLVLDDKLVEKIEALKNRKSYVAEYIASGWENRILEDDGDWYCRETLIAHACGGGVGLPYTNSLDALQWSIARKFPVVEVDVVLGSDGEPLCSHEDVVEKTAMFLKRKADGRFTTMTLRQCLQLAKEHDLSVVLDVKKREELSRVAAWLSAFPQQDKPNIIVQIAKEEELQYLCGIPALYNLTFTHDYERVSAFCVSNQIKIVSICVDEILKDNGWKQLLRHNVKVYAHTVNSLEQYNESRQLGVSGVFTDFLTKDALSGGNG